VPAVHSRCARAEGRTFLVQDVTYYSKVALFDAFKSWHDGGPACSGSFLKQGEWRTSVAEKFRPLRFIFNYEPQSNAGEVSFLFIPETVPRGGRFVFKDFQFIPFD